MKDKFYSYSIHLSAYLILNRQIPKEIKTDKDGKFIFIFPDYYECSHLLERYRKIKEGVE